MTDIPNSHTDTSAAAAASMVAIAPSIESAVARYISDAGCNGATCDEIEQALCLTHQCCSARIRALALDHRIMDLGERRKTRSGRAAIVWFSTEQGKP